MKYVLTLCAAVLLILGVGANVALTTPTKTPTPAPTLTPTMPGKNTELITPVPYTPTPTTTPTKTPTPEIILEETPLIELTPTATLVDDRFAATKTCEDCRDDTQEVTPTPAIVFTLPESGGNLWGWVALICAVAVVGMVVVAKTWRVD